MSKKKKVIPAVSKKKKLGEKDPYADTDWSKIVELLEKIHEERKAVTQSFIQAMTDYIESGGSKAYFPAYLKETYGIKVGNENISELLYFPEYTVIDHAKYEFFALRYL
jgi:hypothetical protein